MTSHAHFNIGQLVHHLKFDYRGVVVDVDPEFQGTEEWYEQVAVSHPPRDQPWYHVLVDNDVHMTYVAERHLEPDTSNDPIHHPVIEVFFNSFEGGIYGRRERIN